MAKDCGITGDFVPRKEKTTMVAFNETPENHGTPESETSPSIDLQEASSFLLIAETSSGHILVKARGTDKEFFLLLINAAIRHPEIEVAIVQAVLGLIEMGMEKD